MLDKEIAGFYSEKVIVSYVFSLIVKEIFSIEFRKFL